MLRSPVALSNELLKIENKLKFQLHDNLLLLDHLFWFETN